jgi:serine/threonine-protein kinase
MTERWAQIKTMFHSALARRRGAPNRFLDDVSAGDRTIHRDMDDWRTTRAEPESRTQGLNTEATANLEPVPERRGMVGRTLGRYHLALPWGAGGMGEVYCALDTLLDREVAVKILAAHLTGNPQAMRRFEREAKTVAALSHPNIVALHDFGTQQGVSYAVMELLRGETLRSHVSLGALPWRKAVGIAKEIADGLSAAHEKGITHRDLKPENIFLTSDGRTKILDFGLAQVKPVLAAQQLSSASTETHISVQGEVLGTIGYMSPEQLRGESASAASDIFSFGCVLYEMVAGQRAFKRPSAMETNAAILRDDPPALPKAMKDTPADLEKVISRCLAKNPADRFQSARDLAFALGTISSSSGSETSLVRHKSIAWHKIAPLATVILILVLGLVLALYLFSGSQKYTSLVVMPFDNGSSDPNMDYLSDGITESIINSLSQLPQLRVIPRTTAFSYKGRGIDLKKLGRELGVKAVATGKASLSGGTLVVQADLVDIATGSQIWGEKYNRDLSNIFVVQEEIARRISEKLALRLTDEQQKRLIKRYTQDAEAYQLYMKGRYHLETRTRDGITRAIDYFKQAIARDTKYALAYAGLADSYIVMESPVPPGETMLKAKNAATMALDLDNTIAEAHTSLAAVRLLYDWDWPAAESGFKQAIELNEGYPTAHHWYAQYLTAMARHDEALAQIRRAQELDPHSLIINKDVAWHYYCARLFDQAIGQAKNTLDLDSTYEQAHALLGRAYVKKMMFAEATEELQKSIALVGSANSKALLGYAYAASGRVLDAQQILRTLPEIAKDQYVSPIYVAAINGELGYKEQAFMQLEKAYADRAGSLIHLNVNPMLDSLRTDARFHSLVARLKLDQ